MLAFQRHPLWMFTVNSHSAKQCKVRSKAASILDGGGGLQGEDGGRKRKHEESQR